MTALLVSLLLAFSVASANQAYTGFKRPPLPVSAEQPLASKRIMVLGREMAYVEAGEGDPILFLHGVPTSSYLWRNVMPHLEGQGRVIAVDLVGFGDSEMPASALGFEEHYQQLAAFIAAMDLDPLTLVMHDWGSALGLHYARLHPNKVRAIATMEAIVAPTKPATSYEALRRGTAAFFRKVREPVSGRQAIIDDNYFIESALPQAIVRPLRPSIHERYRAPFRTPASRRFLAMWPEMMPIGGIPARTHELVSAYNQWLEQTDLPWLFLYARPGSLNPPSTADYWTARAKHIEVAYIGVGSHFVQEDQPYAIGRALSDWYRRRVATLE
ncbi:MAG: haloalkane dehalogenase [Pseudomonadota bacterium]